MNVALISSVLEHPATPAPAETAAPRLSWKQALLLAGGAVAGFHVAYEFPPLSCLILVYLFCLTQLSGLRTARQAFYFGLAVGYAVYTPRLTFFWTIFNWPAVVLWTVLAFWIGLFVALTRLCRNRFNKMAAAILIPFIWTGLEYFRSELYYLRFSWLNVGYVFADSPHFFSSSRLGVYGIAFALMSVVSLSTLLSRRTGAALIGGVLLALAVCARPGRDTPASPGTGVRVAGVQWEFPAEFEVVDLLNQALRKHPDAELFVLSEYTLQRPPADAIREWCREHQRHLAVGGKDFLPDDRFHNTVFVVDPKGDIVFRQSKSVPVQFFADGLPAASQRVWDSPWGKIGFAICYDFSYRRVMDRLIEQGAQALVIPTADEISWGEREHRLHARVGPVRAAEYGVPVFRVSSSGISQAIDPHGRVLASAPYPGQGETIGGPLRLAASGRVPLDHWLAPFSVAATAMMILWLIGRALPGRFSRT